MRKAAKYLAIVGTLTCAGMIGATESEATLESSGGITTLHVHSARPLAAAADVLSERFRVAITYEDPPYQYAEDIQDVTESVRKDLDLYPTGRAPRVLIPAIGSFAVRIATTNAAAVLQQIVDAQSARGIGGKFAVERSGKVFHLVPTAVRDVHGADKHLASILDLRISLPKKARTEMQIGEDFCYALGKAAHVKVVKGMGLGSYFSRLSSGNDDEPKYQTSAENEPARAVLLRVLKAVAGRGDVQRWVLFWDIDQKEYMLHVFHVPGTAAPLSTVKPALPVSGGSSGIAVPNPKQ